MPPALHRITSLVLSAFALAVGVCAQAYDDHSLLEAQKVGGDPSRPGNVSIEYYGHDAFKITSPAGVTVLTDPWRNDPSRHYPAWFLRDFPAVRADVVLSTHAHFDHDAVERPAGAMLLDRLVGVFRLGDIEIDGLADKHQCEPPPASGELCPPRGKAGFANAIQVITTGGLHIILWGDNRAVPDPSLDRYLTRPDVMILPVENILTRPEVEAIVAKYDPKAIIPSHYFIRGLNTPGSGLVSADGWVSEQEISAHWDVRRMTGPNLVLSPDELKESHHRIYHFDDHVERN